MKILFVCLGNICRSPMAEAIFRHKIHLLGLSDSIHTNSAGTAGYHIGSKPDHRTIEILRQNGIETSHRAEQVTHLHEDYDHIVAMDHSNLYNLKNLFPDRDILLMRDFDPQNPGTEVPDPYYGDLSDFQEVYEILDRTIDHFITEVVDLKS